MRNQSRGFTLVEALLATALVAVILSSLAFMFQAVVGGWSVQGVRSGVGANVNRAVAAIARDVRNAVEVGSVNANEIRFSADKTTYYVYYLYGPQPTGQYQLKKATLSGGLDGTYAAGSGELIARDILLSGSDLSVNGTVVTIDLTEKRGDNVMRRATKVRPRNV